MKRPFPFAAPESAPAARLFRIALLGAVIAAAQGCAWLVRPPLEDAAARQQVAQWAAHNADLGPLKGLMRIQIEAGGQSVRGRAAWAAVPPDRLRLEMLNPLGQPWVSLAGDGRTITLYSFADREFHRFAQSRKALERLIQVPAGIEDLLDILAGRPPVPAGAIARAAPAEACGVVLESRWHVRLAELRAEACGRIASMALYDARGEIQYRVFWLEWQTIEGHDLPRKVRVTSGAGDGLTLMVERVWIDAAMPEETFVITPPE
jgi:outer membrane biogenesis lipoprotein LolB